MNEKCECCLVSGRNLVYFKSLHISTDLNYLPLKGSESICWECKADILRIWRFHQQVVKAQEYFKNSLFTESFSSLSVSNKSTFDFEFEYQEIKSEPLHFDDEVVSEADEYILHNEEVSEHITRTKTEISHKAIDKAENIYPVNRFTVNIMSEKELAQIREAERDGKRYKLAPYKCESCILAYFSEDGYKKHRFKVHSEEAGNITCKICSSKFKDEISCRTHLDKHYLSFSCNICQHDSHKLKNILQHYQREHEKWIVHQCRDCGQEFDTNRKLRYHRDTKHKVAPKCHICHKTFTTDNSLRVHLEIHAGVTMYKCDICSKSYKGKYGIRSHMRTHESTTEPENSYCTQCDKQFTHVYKYLLHLKNNSKHRKGKQLKFKCNDCAMRFYTRSTLNKHKSSAHDKVDLFVCHFCNKNYSRKDNLKRHMKRRHDGPLARNYSCVHCNRGFTDKSILTNHIRTHTGERPFECSQCPSTFSQKSALQKHIKGIHIKNNK